MNVLHVTLGLGNGGAEGALFRLISNDLVNKHIVISIMGEGKYGKKLERLGVKVYCLNNPRGVIKLKSLIQLFKIIKRINPDVVQTWLYHCDVLAGIICKLIGVKKVVWGIRHANLDPKLNSRMIILLSKLSARISGFIPDKIISCSEKAAQVHINKGYKAEIMEVIPNGYDLDLLYSDPLIRNEYRLNWGVNKECLIMGVVGRWDPLKGHEYFIKAINLFKSSNNNFKCILVGTGMDSTNRELISLLKKYKVQDYFTLNGPESNIRNIMSAIDVLVLPSAGEAFPNVVAEAMACETPCIVTDVGDAALIVGDYGVVVRPRDNQALNDGVIAMTRLMKDKDAWRNLQINCRKRIIDKFSINNMVEQFSNVWHS